MDLPWYWLDLNDFSWDDLTVDYTHFWKNTEQSSGDTFIDDSKVGQLSNIAQCVWKPLKSHFTTLRAKRPTFIDIDFNAKDKDGLTAIMKACINGHKDVIK